MLSMQKLFEFVFFMFLLNISHQKVPKTKCHGDPIKTGQELLDSTPTLFNGLKSGSFDGEMAIKWLQKYAFGVLWRQKIEPNEMNENFKILQNNFCQQLKNGKSMEEAAVIVESAAIKVMLNLDKPNILQNIRQKIAKNSFLDEKNKEKMAKLLGQFQIGMDKFYGVIKVRNATMLQQQQRRRRKRMDSLNIESGGGGGGTNGHNVKLKACIMTMVIGLFAIGMGTLFATRFNVSGLIFCAVTLIFALIVAISICG